MTTFNWTALSNGQSIVFNPNADVLSFNDAAISAADIGLTFTTSAPLTTTFAFGGKSVTLQTSLRTLTTTNLTFVNGSALLVGDNTSGTASDDSAKIMTGGTGNDRLAGLGGNDQLTGGAGNDRFSFDVRGFGSDQIMDFAEGDVIDLSFLGVADLVSLQPFMRQSGFDVVISMGYGFSAETITIKDTTLASLTAASFIFNTSPSGVNQTGTTQGDVLFGGNGDDTLQGGGDGDVLVGGSGNDLLSGGTGSDQLFGGAGNDRFSFEIRGFGSDQIMDFAEGDVIDLSFLGVADLVSLQPFMRQSGFDVVISMGYGFSAETITIKDTTLASLTAASFILNTSPSSINQTGTTQGDVLFGGNGDDTLQGGGDGDVLVGGSGNDLLSGGTGSDQLFGGAGNDRFSFEIRGFGSDQIMDFAEGDVIDLSFLGVADLVSLQPFMRQSGFDVVISMGYGFSAETITIKDTTLASLTAASFIFNTSPSSINQTGTTQGDVLFGGNGDDTLQGGGDGDVLVGGSGNDLLSGGTGSDQLFGGAGNDTLNGDTGNDTFFFNVRAFGSDQIMDFAAGDVIDLSLLGVADLVSLQPFMSQSGSDVVISMGYGGGAETITIKDTTLASLTAASFIFNTSPSGINQTGTAFGDVLFGGNGDDTLQGSGGNDVLVGGSGNDLLSGGTGNDQLFGGAGNDRFSFDVRAFGSDQIMNFAEGDVIDLSFLGVADLVSLQPFMGQSGSDVVIELGYNSVAEAITIKNTTLATLTGASFVFNTSASGINQTGTQGNDVLFGGIGNDTLDGGAGVDTMTGGLGNDTYIVNVATDVITELANAGTDTVQSSVSYTLGAHVENLVLTGNATNGTGNTLANVLTGNTRANTLWGGAGNDSLGGGSGNDTLNGGAGNDTLNGGPGTDRLVGDVGDDLYILTNAGDVVSESANAGTDTVQSSVSYTLSAHVENLVLTGNATNGTGNALANVLTGNTRANTLSGGAGNDSLGGGSGNDTLNGGAGNDTLNGGSGTDRLVGDVGNDLYILTDAGDVVIESANAGTDTVQSSVTHTLAANVENLVLTGNATRGTGNALANELTGNTRANTLVGGDGNDTLSGGAGNDTLVGDGGDDLYILTDAGDVVRENANAGTDTVQSAFTYTLGAHVENLVLTGNATRGTGNALANELTGNTRANTLSGAAGNDMLNGGAGNDTLDGGAGNDTLMGGIGDDLYILTDAGDVVIESANAGTDTVQSAYTHTLAANVENLVLTGNATKGTGNALANELTGNTRANTLSGAAGNDMLNGGAGNDTLDGGAGNDTLMGGIGDDLYILTNAGDVVSENADAGTDTVQSAFTYTLGAHVENLVLTGNATRGTGNALANTITGNTRANTLVGGDGNDTLSGGAGNDTLVGDGGDDLYILTDAGDVVRENANAGTDTVRSAFTYTLGAHVENLVLTGNATRGTGNALANELTGNTRANTLSGAAGNDMLNGGAGNDTLDGGAGNDTLMGDIGDDLYILTDAGDVVSESANAGTDTVQSAFTYTLGAHVENLVLTGNATRGTGNALANELTGNARANTLVGGDGNDTLAGGLGNDTLAGGAGNDRFLFDTPLNGATNVDVISDFNPVDDALWLDDVVFTGLALGTISSSAFRIGTQAQDSSDRIIYNPATGAVLFDVDGTGATPGVQFATLDAGLAVTNSDFIVV